jgi:UDP-N-acetylmuramoylalanine--D-glutamate ligase
MNQTSKNYFIYNLDDEIITKHLNIYKTAANQIPMSMNQELKYGAYIKDYEMYIDLGQEETSMSVYDFALKGKHNQYNTMAACVATATIDIRKTKIREAIQSFQGLEHRMEKVLSVRGVEFINDSKSTNINSTWYALETMTKPTVLILGGIDKGNDYTLIKELVKEKVKAIVCMGVDNKKIHEAFDNEIRLIDTGSAENAVQAAFRLSTVGDVVLLSPACASFDLFNNYEDRGKQFKEAIKNL